MRHIPWALRALLICSISVVGCGADKASAPITPPGTDYGLVSVPATPGYAMGDAGIGNAPVHTVSLAAYRIGGCEVTYELWCEVRDWATANGYAFEHPGQDGSIAGSSTAQQPVTLISWRDCIAWCNAASEKERLAPVYFNAGTDHIAANAYRNSATGGDIGNGDVEWNASGLRLPTEAEWEHAARYTDGVTLAPGDQHCGCNMDALIDNCAWYSANSGDSTHSAGEKHASSLGLKDMSGNTWEWCCDWYGSYPLAAQDNPRGPASGTRRVLRGGSFHYSAMDCRTASRAYENPKDPYRDDGFRVCRSGI